MLLEFGFKNFFSFREGAKISFKLDANCPPSISGGKSWTPVLGIKGANASGKTQILKAIAFLAAFCTLSFNEKPESLIPVESFFGNENDTEFYIEFEINNAIYYYELICNQGQVINETLHIKNKRKNLIFDRNQHQINTNSKEYKALEAIKLRKNVSVISMANQYGFKEIEEVFNFFKNITFNVTVEGLREDPYDIKMISKILNDSDEALSFVSEFIAECDAGVDEISIVPSIEDSHLEAKKQNITYTPAFWHSYSDGRSIVSAKTESSGTKELYGILPFYRDTLMTGGLLIIDEFDIHLHPFILPKLLNLFLNDASNPKKAQLLFTTHDERVFDLLGRYRLYLVNKNNNESFTYRLDEIPGDIIRNDRSILPAYQAGKIGGVPKL